MKGKKEKIEMIKQMLKEQIPIETIMKITKLTKEEIENHDCDINGGQWYTNKSK